MAGRVAPVPPFVDLPSLPRPQVVDEGGFELTDEQIEALAAQVTGDDKHADEEEEEKEEHESAHVSVAEGDEPEARQPLLGLDQSLVLQYSILQTRHHHMRQLLPLIFTHPPVPAHNRPRLRVAGKKEFAFPTPPPPPQPLPSAEYHGPSTKKTKKKGKDKEKEGDADDKEEKSGDESDEPKKGRKKEQTAPAHEIECIARVTLQVGPMSFPNTELWVARFVPPRQGSAGTVRGRLKGMTMEPRKKEPKPKEPKEKVRKERALPRMSIDGGAPKRPRTEKPKPKPSAPLATPASPAPAADVPPRFASRQDIPQALIQRVNAAATRHPWLSVLIHKAARSVASKDELAKLGRVVARLGRGEDVGEGPEMPGVPVRPPIAAAGPSRPPVGVPMRPPDAVAGPSRPPMPPGARPPMAGVRPPPVGGFRPPNAVAGPPPRPGAPLARPPATAASPPTPGAPGAIARPPVGTVRPPPPTGAVRPPASAVRPAAVAASAMPRPPPIVPSGTPAPAPALPAAPTSASAPVSAPPPPASVTDKPEDPDSDVDMSGRPQVGGGLGDEPESDSDWDAGFEMKGRPQVGGGEGEETHDDNREASTPGQPASTPASAPVIASQPAETATALIPTASAQVPTRPTVTTIPAPTAPVMASSLPSATASASAHPSTPRPALPSGPHPVPPSAARPPVAAGVPPPGMTSGGNVRWFPVAGSPKTPISNPATTGTPRGPIRVSDPRSPSVQMVPPSTPVGTHPPPFLLVAFKGQETEKFLLPLGQHSYLSRVGGDYITSPPPTPAAIAAPVASTTASATVASSVAQAPASTPAEVTPVQPSAEVEQPPVEEPRGKKRTRASIARAAPKPPTKPAPAQPAPTPKQEKVKEPTPPPVDPLANIPPMPGQPPAPGTVLLSTYIPIEPYIKPDWPKLAERLPFHNPAFIDKLKVAPMEAKTEPLSPKRALRHVREDKRPREYLLNVAAEEWLPEGPLEPVTIRLLGVDDRTWARMKSVVEQVEKTELEAMVRAEPRFAPEVVKAMAEAEAARAAPPAPAPAHVPLPIPSQPAAAAQPATPAAAISAPISGAPAPPVGAAPPTAALPTAAGAAPSASAPASVAQPAAPTTSTTPGQVQPPPKAPTAVTIPPLPPLVRETWLARKKSLFTDLLARVGLRRFPRFRIETTNSTLVDFTTDKWAPRPYHLTTRPLYARDADSDDELPVVPRRVELSPSPDLEGHTKKRRKEVSAVTFEMPVSLDALDERVEAGAARGLSKRGRAKGAAVVRKFPRGTAGAPCEGCARRGLKVWRRGPNGRGTLCNDCGDKFSAGTLGELKAPGAASRRDSTGTPGGDDVKVERESVAPEGEEDKDEGEPKDGKAGGDGEASTRNGRSDDPNETQSHKATGDDVAEPDAEAPAKSADRADSPEHEATSTPAPSTMVVSAAASAVSSPDPLALVDDDADLAGGSSTEAAAPSDAMDIDP